jgi:HAMP domain-containing protein
MIRKLAWNSLNVSLKFLVILGLVFLGGSVLSFAVLSNLHNRTATDQVSQQAIVLMETIDSVRQYTNAQVSDLLEQPLESQDRFIPEAIPSYAARQVFEQFRGKKGFENYLYKDATLNPTNLRDRADPFEAELVEQFRRQPNLEELQGFRNILGQQHFYVARPLVIRQPQCLRCHSTPEAAPKSQIAMYGAENGFGWQLGEIIGAQTIYVPASAVFDTAFRDCLTALSVFIGIFALVIVIVNRLVRQLAIAPLGPIAQLARKISNNELSGESEAGVEELRQLDRIARRQDEFGQLSRLFREMAQAIYSRERNFLEQLQRLRLESDRARQSKAGREAELKRPRDWRSLVDRARQLRQHGSTED